MELEIDLPEAVEAALAKRAKKEGVTTEDLIIRAAWEYLKRQEDGPDRPIA